jgi:hypothetical protein
MVVRRSQASKAADRQGVRAKLFFGRDIDDAKFRFQGPLSVTSPGGSSITFFGIAVCFDVCKDDKETLCVQ